MHPSLREGFISVLTKDFCHFLNQIKRMYAFHDRDFMAPTFALYCPAKGIIMRNSIPLKG